MLAPQPQNARGQPGGRPPRITLDVERRIRRCERSRGAGAKKESAALKGALSVLTAAWVWGRFRAWAGLAAKSAQVSKMNVAVSLTSRGLPFAAPPGACGSGRASRAPGARGDCGRPGKALQAREEAATGRAWSQGGTARAGEGAAIRGRRETAECVESRSLTVCEPTRGPAEFLLRASLS
jgi:hypothetical protein